MAKSRKRKFSGRSSSSGGYRPPDKPYRSITSQMTPAYHQAVREGADAELRGDAAEALRLHRSVPMFRRSTHGDRLQQLAELGADAPGWLIDRWLTIQARRRMWTGGDEAATNRVLQLVVPMVYPEGIPFERIGCAYPEQVIPFINDRDWVVRQVDVYELAGLRRLIERFASPELLSRADQIEAWFGAPMSVSRVEKLDLEHRGSITVTDLTSREAVEVLDLGLSELLDLGQHLLGRIVPISDGPGSMFEWRPLSVDQDTANAVAVDPRRWLPTLQRLGAAGRLEPAYSHQPESSLTSDLPWHAWMSLAGVRVEHDRDPNSVVVEAMREALVVAGRGAGAVAERRHLISELVLDVAFSERVRWRFVGPEFLPAWRLLAEVLPEHARSRCEEMVMWCAATPDLPDAIA
jgi:hypothetical protein